MSSFLDAQITETLDEEAEYHIRQVMNRMPIDQLKDLLKAGVVILETREMYEPKRKRRSDAGKKRNEQPSLLEVK